MSIFLNFWTHRHKDTEMDTELDNITVLSMFCLCPYLLSTNKLDLSQLHSNIVVCFRGSVPTIKLGSEVLGESKRISGITGQLFIH